MRYLFAFSTGVVLGYTTLFFVHQIENTKPDVLSKAIEINQYESTGFPTQTPSPSPTIAPSPFPTKVPSPTPVPTKTPAPLYSQEQIHGFIERFSGQYGVDTNVLRHIANCESGFNQNAQKLHYAGLFQFSQNSWNKYRNMIGESPDPTLRFDAEEAVQTASFVLSINEAYIWPNCTP